MIDLFALPYPALDLALLPVAFLIGLGLGFAYFRALRFTTALILQGGSLVVWLALTLARIAGLGLGFYLALQLGGLAVVAMLAGVTVAKVLATRSVMGAGA